jgi:hypothetical protein
LVQELREERRLAFPPNYRQGRTDRTRTKNKKAQEKLARRHERSEERKSHQIEEAEPDSNKKTEKEPG